MAIHTIHDYNNNNNNRNSDVVLNMPTPSLALPGLPNILASTPQTQTIQEIALQGLKEFAYHLAIAGVCCCFVATSAIPTFLIGVALIVTFITVTKMLPQLFDLYVERNETNNEIKKWLVPISNMVSPLLLSVLDLSTRDTLIHEAGHAITANILYDKAAPIIKLFPFSSSPGVTHFSSQVLSPIGQFFGKTLSAIFVAGAGTAFTTVLATGQIAAAHYLREKHPKISNYLMITAISSIVSNVFYALSALFTTNPSIGHDFIQLWSLGVHPIIPAICMIALPVFVFYKLNGNKFSIS